MGLIKLNKNKMTNMQMEINAYTNQLNLRVSCQTGFTHIQFQFSSGLSPALFLIIAYHIQVQR